MNIFKDRSLLSFAKWEAICSSRQQSPALRRSRDEVILTRLRSVAVIFSVLTLLWVIVDFRLLASAAAKQLAAGRLICSIGFLALSIRSKTNPSSPEVMIRLVMLFSVASAFILYACWVLTAHGFDLDAANPLLSTYRLGFVVVVVGISLFPLTLVEGVSFAIAVLAAAVVNELNMGSAERLFLSLGHLWLMFVVAAVAVLASLSQTNFMAFLTERAAVDRLTGLLTREFGVELLDIQYQIAIRSKGELTLLLFDLDKFKAVNDTFGHPEGDRVLSATAASIRSTLRQQDIAIRWGGEEFLVVLPNTGEAGAAQVIARLARHGLTKRPNNEPQTASIGVVSTIEDSGGGWQQLVAIADQRLYIAKQNNRNCWVGSEGISNSFIGIPSLSA